MNQTLIDIKAEFLDEAGWAKKSPLPREQVLRWMKSDDLEVLGATHRLLHVKEHLYRVQPTIEFEEFYEFMTRYYRHCLCEYTEKAWDEWEEADLGTDLTHHIVYWFIELWQDKSVPRQTLTDLKEWLADVLINCTASNRLLSTAVGDHLLKHKKIGKLFADWRDKPELQFIFIDK